MPGAVHLIDDEATHRARSGTGRSTHDQRRAGDRCNADPCGRANGTPAQHSLLCRTHTRTTTRTTDQHENQ